VDLLRPALTVGTTMIEVALKRQNERNMEQGNKHLRFAMFSIASSVLMIQIKGSTSTTVLELKVFVKDFIYSVVY